MNSSYIHYFFILAFVTELIFILFSQETRTNWIVLLLFTGMIYAIVGWWLNQHELEKVKQLKSTIEEKND